MAQKTDSELLIQSSEIKNETGNNLNTATRVGQMLEDIIDSKYNRPYKVYIALLTQTGKDNPTADILENTLGYNIDWIWQNDGYYASIQQFEKSKTYLSITNNSFNTQVVNFGIDIYSGMDIIQIYTGDQNDKLVRSCVEIRVYN